MKKLEFLRACLATHWGSEYASHPIVPLRNLSAETVTHTSEHWVVGPPACQSLLKVARKQEFARDPKFYEWKRDLLDYCLENAIPVAPVRSTLSGSPYAEVEGHFMEMTEFVPNARPYSGLDQQVDAMIAATLALRAVLDALPASWLSDVRDCPLPKLVDEDRLEIVLEQARELLPLARTRRDPWGRAASRQLAALCSAGPLLVNLPPMAQDSVVHGDLHGYNMLFRSSTVKAILDFDNMHAGSRYLDLAWIADMAAWQPGGEKNWKIHRASRAIYAAVDHKLLRLSGVGYLMPCLIAYAAPIILDIAKDILHRGIFNPAWFRYFDILDVDLKLRIDVNFQEHFGIIRP